ncbi:hypothetical protein Cgig2_021656 [Carnegiea gigantea]|uniref:Uncharacterized protein n=1 Tax=Carnegiea gigantea TaxID=171969 RepID=A0A9Q1KB01_9CARY|nr:hypothetical protein Cgig2_021656 [Carnegiea gigantea]
MEEVVIEALTSHQAQERIHGAMELNRLTSKQKHKLIDKGIIHPLVSMLESNEYEAIEAALLALLSLAYGSERNKIKIAESRVIHILLKLIHFESVNLTELSIATMFILSSCTTNRVSISSSGAIPILIEILHWEGPNISDQAKLDAIATLLNLSSWTQIIPSLVSSNLLTYLLHTIYASQKYSYLVEKAAALLEKVISSSESALENTAAMPGAIQALVETIEDGSPEGKEHAVRILLLISQNSRDKYRELILREGVMPGLLQLSVDGTWRARNLAQTLLQHLRDGSSNGSDTKQLKNEVLEHIMERIDHAEDDGFDDTALCLVEQMIAKLAS